MSVVILSTTTTMTRRGTYIRRRFGRSRCCGFQTLFITRSSSSSSSSSSSTTSDASTESCYYSSDAAAPPGSATTATATKAPAAAAVGGTSRRKRGRSYYSSSSNVRQSQQTQSPSPVPSPILSVLTSPFKLAERLECRQAAARTARFRHGHGGDHDHHSWYSQSSSSWGKYGTGTSNSSNSTSMYRGVTTESKSQPSSYQSSPSAEGPRLLCLDIQRYRMDLAVVGHPRDHSLSFSHAAAAASFVPVPSIPTPSRTITSCTISKLWDVIQQHQICGFLVNWPIQQDTLKFGAACGRVIFTIEKLQTESMVNPDERPVCLFPTTTTTTTSSSSSSTTTTITKMAQKQDKWGRCPGYGRTLPVYEDDLRHLRAMFQQDDDQDHGHEHEHEHDFDKYSDADNDPQNQDQGQDQEEQEHIYYYDALRGRYYGGGGGTTGTDPSSSSSSSSSSLFSEIPSPSDLPVTARLWDQFCATSWPLAASSQKQWKHQASTFIIDSDEHASSSSASRTTSWTRPSRCKTPQRTGNNKGHTPVDERSRWGRRHIVEYNDDEFEEQQAASSKAPPKTSSKHLLVDRALRQAAGSSTTATPATAQAA